MCREAMVALGGLENSKAGTIPQEGVMITLIWLGITQTRISKVTTETTLRVINTLRIIAEVRLEVLATINFDNRNLMMMDTEEEDPMEIKVSGSRMEEGEKRSCSRLS